MTSYNILLFLHFVAIGVGGAANFGIPAVGAAAARMEVPQRPTIEPIVRNLIVLGHGALGVLILTGALLAWLSGAWSGGDGWFWTKMSFVVLLLAGIVLSARNGKRAMNGDPEATARAPKLGLLNNLAFVAVVFAAVATFR
jgi:protoporphyrinogen IX oxidase